MKAAITACVLVVAGLLAYALWPADTGPTPGRPSAAAHSFPLVEPAVFNRDITASEKAAKAVVAAVKRGLLVAVRERDWAAARSALASGFVARFAPLSEAEPVPGAGDFEIHTLPTAGAVMDGEGFVAALKSYFDQLAAVERTSLSLYRSLVAVDGKQAFGEGHLQVSGVGAGGARMSWVGSVKLWMSGGPTSWQLAGMDVVEGSWGVSRRPAFADVAPAVGFAFHDSHDDADTAKELINMRRLFSSGGLTVLDANRDGFWDVLATREGRGTTLFENDGHGGFMPRVIEALGPPSQAAKFHLWIDLDDDGLEELVSTRVRRGRGGEVELSLYTTGGGQLARRPGALVFDAPRWRREMDFEAIVTCDVDGDQDLDLLVLGYMHADSAGSGFNLVDGNDGLANLLFINQGGLRFTEEAVSRGITGTRYSYVAECFDFDFDGDADVFVGNDYGSNDYYANTGDGSFEEDPAHPFRVSRGFTMGFSMADYDNTGRWAVSLSNMYSHAGNRIVPLVTTLSEKMREQVYALAAGNDLFEQVDGTWRNTSKARGVDYAHWAWGNVFFDVDNDADKDLYVVNGFTSHTDASAPDW